MHRQTLTDPSNASATMSRRGFMLRAGGMVGVLSSAGLLAACGREEEAEGGISKSQVTIGTTLPLSGPVASFGQAYRDGFEAYFAYVNEEQGGVDGRRIELLIYDDGYQVPKTVDLTRRLVESDQVFATLFQLGTPTNQAINGYLNRRRIPNFPASNASIFGDPRKSPWTVVPTGPTNFRAGEIIGQYVVETAGEAKLAALAQNDQLGKEYLAGFKAGLGSGGGRLVETQTYDLTDSSLDTQVVNLRGSGAEVWFLAATTKFAVLAVRKAFEIGWRPDIYAVQQATDGKTMKAMGEAATGRLVTYQTLKDPASAQYEDDPDILEFQQILERHRASADPTDLRVTEAMGEAKLFAAQVARMQEPTRQALVDAYRSVRDFDTGAYLSKFTARPGTNFLVDGLRLARWDESQFAPFGDLLT